MRISVTIFVILISTCIVNASVLDPVIENVVHLKASKPPSGVAGIWKKKTIWKPRWVKEWKSSRVMKPVWKKVWSPVQIREWVPIPKPPPGWDSISTPLSLVHPKRQKAPIKDSAGHDSFTVHTATKIPLWDPIPYPESQQPPPPPPFPQPVQNAESTCGKVNCDNSHSATTFNHQQISEIIGSRYNTPEYVQNEFSETVNHLTRLPPDGNDWKPPPQKFQSDNRFNNFLPLPEYLIPPTYPPGNDFPLQLNHYRASVPNQPVIETQNGIKQFTPIIPEANLKGHLITKQSDQPYKFAFPETQQNAKNNTLFSSSHNELASKPNFHIHNKSNSSFRPHTNSDFIQQAQLVGEYHYSEFDLPDIKQPQHDKKERVKPDLQKLISKNQPKHNLSESIQPQNQHIQKKHISFFSFNSSNSDNNFQQQKASLKEIFPTRNYLNKNNTQNHRLLQSNDNKHHSSTALFAVGAEPNFNSTNDGNQLQETAKIESIIPSVNIFSLPIALSTSSSNQQQRENYPVYEISQHHRFSVSSLSKLNTYNTNDSIRERKGNHPINKIPPKDIFSLPTTSYNATDISDRTQEQKENYPVYKIPPNHKFSAQPLSNINVSSKNNSNQQQNENQIHKIPFIQKLLLPTKSDPFTTNDSNKQQQLTRLTTPFLFDFKALGTNKTSQEQKENYPVYNPENYKLLSAANIEPQEKLQSNHTTKLLPIASNRIEKPLEKSSSVQLIFPTTPNEPLSELQNVHKTTTTEPYSVIFSSSLLLTTEAVTRSPVIIVTPVSQNNPNQV